MWSRIKLTNYWKWPSINLAFGTLRRLANLLEHYRKTCDMSKEEAEAYVYGEYPGADPILSLLTYLTKPGQLVVSLFAGSGADKDACEHFLDPRWPGDLGQWIWWNHWADYYRDDHRSGRGSDDLNEHVFPRDYWAAENADHSRKCIQFDLEPNTLALAEYGPDFILGHDVCEGITTRIINLVYGMHPDGATLVWLDPPYLSQAHYGPVERISATNTVPRSLESDLPLLQVSRSATSENPLLRARAKVAANACENNLCRMG
ncbi:MAG: hypothetical protein ACYTG0_46405, partial [Planctomycetota bacterium]